MNRDQVRTPADGWIYLLDCTLATVCALALRTRPPKYELERQCAMAQRAMQWMEQMGVDYSSTRAHQVKKDFGGSVTAWAEAHKRRA